MKNQKIFDIFNINLLKLKTLIIKLKYIIKIIN